MSEVASVERGAWSGGAADRRGAGMDVTAGAHGAAGTELGLRAVGIGIVGIVGTGAFASAHAAALARHPRLRLAGFAGAAPGSGDAIAARFAVRSYPSGQALFDDPAVDAVIIATPHATHAALAEAALRAGKHVLIEKPVTVTTDEATRLSEVAAASGARAMVGHLMRWAPAHVQARALVESGAIGEVVAAESCRVIPWNAPSRRPWHLDADAGGGMWLVQGVHVLDQLRWLLGVHPDRAVGTAATLFHPAQTADDFGTALLDYAGVPASLAIAGVAHGPAEVRTDLYGTLGVLRVSHRGLLQVDTGDGWEDRLEQTSPPVDNPPVDPWAATLDGETSASAGRPHPPLDHWAATLDGELDEFARVIDGAAPATDLEYGRRILATVEAVRRSHESGRWEAIA